MTRPGGYVELLRSRDYTLLWIGQVASSLGDAVYEIALIWLVLDISGQDYGAVGTVLAVRLGAGLLSGPWAGVLVDRWPRKTTLVTADLTRGLLILVLPVLHYTASLHTWHVAAVAAGLTVARTFFNPALQATVPQLVPPDHLNSANAFLHAAMQTMYAVGPAATGLALARTSPSAMLIVDSVTFFVSAASLAGVSALRDTKEPTATSVLTDMRDMVREVYRIPLVFWSIVLFAAGLLAVAGTLRVGVPALAESVLGGGARDFGLIMSAVGVGTVIGALLIGRASYHRNATVLFAGWVAWGVCFVALAWCTSLPAALIVAGLAGAAEGVTDVAVVTLIQRFTPADRLGRAFSLFSLTAAAGDATSSMVTGHALRRWSTDAVFVVAGGLAVIVGGIGIAVAGRLEGGRSATRSDTAVHPGTASTNKNPTPPQ